MSSLQTLMCQSLSFDLLTFLNYNILCLQITVASVVSRNAYTNWDENPILTTVSTTAYPIHSLEYPAITICGQVTTITTIFKKQNYIISGHGH